MQNEDVKAEERPKGACFDASYCKKNFITMQNEDVKAGERPKGACLDASYCKKELYNLCTKGLAP